MRCITLHGFDEIGNQVVAALELDVHLSPGVLRGIAQTDESVVESDDKDEEEGNESEDDPEYEH